MIKININETVYSLVTKYPNIKEVMVTLGFSQITNPISLQTIGKIMTLKKGAKVKQIDIASLQEAFLAHGYILEE